ncbi:MAG: hypothetical protein L3J71_15890 [Victivallaceae bacterium]|nr:hypothetical protein [Victivallaceae bacterium]
MQRFIGEKLPPKVISSMSLKVKLPLGKEITKIKHKLKQAINIKAGFASNPKGVSRAHRRWRIMREVYTRFYYRSLKQRY